MEACLLRKTFVHPSAPYTLENSTLPSIPLGDSWVNHYKRLLRDTYPWVKRLEHFQALGQAPTESSWRSYVYTHSESIFLDDPELHAECNSQLNTTAKHHPAKTSRPDVSMGVVSSVAPNVLPGCRTGSLSLCFADGEEKRHPENKSDEAKLLCVMSARMHHIKDSLKLPWSGIAPVADSKNIPLPVAVGTLRCGSKWSVYLMWRRESRKPFQWAKIIDEKDLGKPDEFLHYTTFTFRLFRYGQMFKKAIKTIIANLESETEESDEEGELEVSEAEADDHGHSPLPEQPPAQAQQGGQPSKGPATSEPAQGDRQWDQTHVFSRDKERGYNITLGGTRQDGLYVVRKNSKLHAPKRHRREVNAYKLLRDQGMTPKLLGHWKDVTTEHLVMELEYQPSIRNYYPTTMKELRQYMVSILQILAHLHDTVGMIHRDIKRANILAYKTSSGDLEVKLVDFEFSYLFTQPFKECDFNYGTYGYISPECWDAWYGDASLEEQKQTVVTGAGDMFALGVILVEFLFGIRLDGQQRQSIELTRFLGEVMTAPGTTQQQGHQLVKDHRSRLEQFIRQLKVESVWTCDFRLAWLDDGGEALDLAQSLTRHAPGGRLTAAQALAHPFLSEPRTA